MTGLADLHAHVAQILEVELMMPRHLGATALCILTGAVLQVVILLDEGPEVIALHVGSIGFAIDFTLLEVPAVKFLTRSRHVDKVAGSRRVVVHVAVEDVRVAAVSVRAQIAVLISIVNEAERRG